jgi:hypothetical protein
MATSERYPAGITYRCSGCGVTFTRTGQGWLSHPEPWCLDFIQGTYQPEAVES